MFYKETDIQHNILTFLKHKGIHCWRNNTGRRGKVNYGFKGSSDIIGILPDGRFLAIEVKKPKQKPSADQREFLDRINSFGGFAIWVTSLDEARKQMSHYL